MTEPVRYIERTHAWYAALGYEAPYRYAQFEEVPFVRLAVPLAKAQIVLLTTAAPFRAALGGQGVGDPYNARAKFYEVYSADTEAEHDLRVSHVAVHREHLQNDQASWFPLNALRQARATGRIGRLAPRFIGVPTNRSQRHTSEVDALQVAALCAEMKVDAAILVPNCPVCHQTLAIIARMLEARNIATVVMGVAKDIVERVGVPRFLFSDFPLGSAAARPFDPPSAQQMLEQALQLLESAEEGRSTWTNPLGWNGKPTWRDDYLNLANLSSAEIASKRADNERNREQALKLRSPTINKDPHGS